jgi:phosphoglycerate dehydrogenase-like enzyme
MAPLRNSTPADCAWSSRGVVGFGASDRSRDPKPCGTMRSMSACVLEFIRDPRGVWSLPAREVDRLRGRFPAVRFVSPRTRDEVPAAIADADVVLGWAVTAETFPLARRLRWVHLTAAGVGAALFPELIASEVVMTNARGLHAAAMAEHAIGLMLSFARKLHLARDAQRERRWVQRELMLEEPPFRELRGGTLVLIGMGYVGSAVAERARALGMRVIAVRRHPAPTAAPAHEQWPADRLNEALALADWVVLAAPLTPDTKQLIGREALARMKSDAVLINLGRGAVVDESALIEALERGRLGGAGLDVTAEEPLDETSALWRLPQVIVTPHVSGLAPQLWERAMDQFAGNLERFLAGRPLENVVDKRAGY